MTRRDEDGLFRYYAEELTYLRQAGAAFAERHPHVAGRLELGAHPSPDPHVERLLEGFAFLTGRLQHNIDRLFPEIAAELLGVLYPHLLEPVPPAAIARFEVEPGLAGAFEIPRETPLFAQIDEETACRLRTCYPVTLWPVEVAGAEYLSTGDAGLPGPPRGCLRLRIAPLPGASLADLPDLDRLRFYLNAEPILAGTLRDLLSRAGRVFLEPDGQADRRIPLRNAIRSVGFGPGEEVLPVSPHGHPAYRLLQEYFTFPEQFLFFDVTGLTSRGPCASLDLLIPLEHDPRLFLYVQSTTFLLGCTPVVNLFPKTTEPIRLDHRKTEYLLVPDARREETTEIHSILSVSSVPDPAAPPGAARVYEPYYSFHHGLQSPEHRAFWHARRRPSRRPGLPGTEIALSFLDLDFNPALPESPTVYAHTLCTNRHLAARLRAGFPLQCDRPAPGRIFCLTRPTPQIPPPTDGETLWRLVSHLSLNHLSLETGGGEDSQGLLALREILRLYSGPENPAAARQIDGLRDMSTRPVVRRAGSEPWRGFCRGLEITLVLDESCYTGASASLFASVLRRFFALYVSVNSFVELAVRLEHQPDTVWKTWPPLTGHQTVL